MKSPSPLLHCPALHDRGPRAAPERLSFCFVEAPGDAPGPAAERRPSFDGTPQPQPYWPRLF